MKQRAIQLHQTRVSLILMAGLLAVALLIGAIVGFVQGGGQLPESVRITEIMLSNSTYPDPDGVCADWIELQNVSQKPVDLAGLILTDDPDQAKFVFGAGSVLEPGQFRVVYCISGTQNTSYAPFGLSRTGGEKITLMDRDRRVISQVTSFALSANESMAWQNDAWSVCEAPSPGYANTQEGHAQALQASGQAQIKESALELEITEAVSQNKSGLTDADGQCVDWLEITNRSDETLSLEGLGLSTSQSDPYRWRFPAGVSLEPGKSLVVLASGKNRLEPGELHTSFRLSSQGETLFLTDADAALVDQCVLPALEADQAWQKGADGSFSATFAQTPGVPGAMSQDQLQAWKGKLVINELCASYSVGRGPGFDTQSDWIELKNLTNTPIDLSGFYLSDKGQRPEQALKGTLPAGGVLLLWADSQEGGLHCGFSLSRTQETVVLYAPWGTPVDQVSYSLLEDNLSWARQADGTYAVCAEPTPGFENTAQGLEAYYQSFDRPGELVISEVMTGNYSLLPQSYGKYYDWIELKNIGTKTLNLSGYTLSDSRDKPDLYALPALTLAPGDTYVLLASGDPSLSTKSYKHTPFKLSNEGDSLFLFDAQGALLDCVAFGDLPAGCSFGRMDAKPGFFYFAQPTPGAANTGGKRLVTSAPVSLTPVGAHNDTQSLQIALQGEGELYYTLDGSWPTKDSARYTQPISVNETTVLRCFAVAPGKLDSAVTSCTYLLNEGHTLPVVSVCTNPADLWDYNSGIYVKGPGAAATHPFRGANYYKDWEKAANVTFYDDRGQGFSVDCGLKIFGNTGRALDKKSFQLKFKSRYGTSQLVYDLFDNTQVNVFDSLVLRSGSQDYQSSLIRDAILSQLCSQGMPETEAQAYRYCVLYLNGEYWGIYCFREKLDEDFVAAHYNVTPESANVLGYTGVVQSGSSKTYRDVISYVKSHDLSQDVHYQWVADRVCLESYIDWFIAQAYVGNSDLDNVRFFASDDYDGKWRWILYDFDLTFYRNANPYSYLISTSAYYSDVSLLMRHLMKNASFRDLFLTQLGRQLKTTFSQENVLSVIDSLAAQLEPEIPRERERWDMTTSGWKNSVEALRKFVRGKSGVSRTQEIINDVSSAMGLTQKQIQKYFG